MNQIMYTAPKLDTVVNYKTGDPMVNLLRDHVTNMTSVQRKVCLSVADEWNEMVKRVQFLETENAQLIQDVARLTHDITALRTAKKARASKRPVAKPRGKKR